MKAQIFLSCGQNSEERPIAQAIKEIIEHPDSGLGFDCFVASEQQDLTGLREIVFKRLEEADYFVFSDNFVIARRSFVFEFGQTLESGKLF
jgi:hypothetical protein